MVFDYQNLKNFVRQKFFVYSNTFVIQLFKIQQEMESAVLLRP